MAPGRKGTSLEEGAYVYHLATRARHIAESILNRQISGGMRGDC